MTSRLRWVQHFAVLSAGLLLVTASAPSRAQQPLGNFTPKITQYRHTAWRLQDAAFAATPLSIAQTTDGYIWVGTESGLTRFDGVQFLPVGDSSSAVHSLLGSRDGALWVGVSPGVMRIGGPNLSPVPKLGGRVNGFAEDDAGNIWLARTRIGAKEGPLCRITGPQSRCFGPADGFPCAFGQAVLTDHARDVWLNDGRNLCKFSNQSQRIPLPGNVDAQAEEPLATGFVSSADGGVLVGMERPVKGALLMELVSGRFQPFPVRGLDEIGGDIEALLRAKDGSLWAGTMDHGLFHIHDGVADHFGTADGLSGDSIAGILQDREGSIWVATSNGVDHFQVPKVLTFSTREGLASDRLSSVAAAHNGDLWIGTDNGLVRMHDGQFSSWNASNGLSGNFVRSMLVDRRGILWLGVNSDLLYFANGEFKTLKAPGGSSVGIVENLAEDAAGTIWVKTAARVPRLFRVSPANVLEVVDFPNGPPSQIASDPQGGLWLLNKEKLSHFGTAMSSSSEVPSGSVRTYFATDNDSAVSATSTGLQRWNGKAWSSLSAKSGLPCSNVRTMLLAQNYGWWLSLTCGNAFVPWDQVREWKLHPDARLRVISFDALDGARPSLTPFGPPAAVTPDGRAWFVTRSGLQMIDLAHLPSDILPPPVHVTDFVADNKSLGARENLRLAPLTRSIRIDYNGLSFVTPQKVRFKYRLSGIDSDWQDVGSRREAFYMHLPPGSYVFRVIASNSDGVWNLAGDSLRFTLPPTFYQTRWFMALEIGSALLLLFLVFRIRIMRATQLLNAQHGERLAERDRIARELHDTLLQGFHGLMLRLHTGVEMIPPAEPAKAILHDAIDRADLVLVEGRNSVQNLRAASSDRPRLSAELERVASGFRTGASPACVVLTAGSDRPIDPVAYDELFAIGREAIFNAFRHADATGITIELRFERRQFVFTCRDDGRGIAPTTLKTGSAAGRFGLLGMNERARKLRGELKVEAAQPHGAVITLRVPARSVYARGNRGWGFFSAGPRHDGV